MHLEEVVSRRAFLAGALGGAVMAGLPGARAWATAPPACRAGSFRTSLSVSPFAESVLRQAHLTDGQTTARNVRELQQLFGRHGATEVYARIATLKHDPSGDSEMGWARGLERARLARDLGMSFNPELGLWATYGDAANYQGAPDFRDYPSIRLPGPWHTLKLGEMTHALHAYGALVAGQILATGVRVNVWDLGNEVEFGLAGISPRPLTGGPYKAPDAIDPAIGEMSVYGLIMMSESARIAWCRRHLWPAIGELLAATAAGIRSVDRTARFSTHISGIFQDTPEVTVAFWQTMHAAGYRPHQLGTSYYPTAGAIGGRGNRLTWLKDTARTLAARFHRPMFIAEYGYPSGHLSGGYPYNVPVPGYPQTISGQDRFTADLVSWGLASGHLAGLRPWAPDYCTTSWEPMSFFTVHQRTARAKPGLRSIATAVRHHCGGV